MERPYFLTYSYDIVLLYYLGCIHPIPTCQILITLVKESILTICTDNVNAICATTISFNLQWWYCIAIVLGSIQTLPTCQTLIELITSEQIISMARWLPLTGIYRFELAVGTSSQSAHSWTESTGGQEAAKKTTKKNYFNDPYLKRPLSIHWCCLKTNPQISIVVTSTPY